MKKFSTVIVVLVFFLQAVAQQKSVLLMQGVPVIKYKLTGKESSYEVYKKFGMDEATFLMLNTASDSAANSTDEDVVFVTVSNTMLMQCSEPTCVELVYMALEGDNFKNIGTIFGNLNPYLIKQLNPQLEAVAAGKLVKVGYLPGSLFPARSHSAVTDSVGKADTVDVPVKTPMIPKSDTVAKSDTTVLPYSGAGYFAGEFKEPASSKVSGKVGNFKSFGGWYDGKFYILINNVEIGKVVKVTNTQNGQYIYAKVVSALPDVKSEKTMVARINNAASAALDIWDEADFEAEVAY